LTKILEVNMATYQHKPLGDSSREIRLVNLQPGHRSDPIQVKLTHALLDGDIAYDALSYAWGDPNIRLPIAIDGLLFQVNLESALRYLRLPTEARLIWINAICIHQTNVEERDQQVRRMGSVYDNAKNILVWLGPEADDSDLAVDLLGEQICEKLFIQEPGAHSHSLMLEGGNIRYLIAVLKLFHRPWWRRGWIIQEIIGAGTLRENVLLHCGNSKKRWEVVYFAIRQIWDIYFRQVGSERESSMHGAWCKKLVGATRNPESLGHAWDLELEDWLALLKSFETSEPKDKVWIACLLTQHREPISGLNLQYQQSLQETYIFIAQHLLRSQGSLRVLERCADYSDLPSWVPHWRLSETAPLSGRKPDRFKARGPLELFYEILENSDLHLKGFYIGCAARFPPLKHTSILDPRILERNAAEIGSTYYITGEPSINALIKTMFTDMPAVIHFAWEWLRAIEEREIRSMTKYRSSEFPFENYFPRGSQAALSTALAMNGRKYFVSANGYIGLVPEAAQEEDMICIFMGGMTPFVIRPAGENYQLIGACYIHGIMHGEAVTEFFENKSQEMQEFILD
jgi:hypothetical protein